MAMLTVVMQQLPLKSAGGEDGEPAKVSSVAGGTFFRADGRRKGEGALAGGSA